MPYLSHLGKEQIVQIYSREKISDILQESSKSESLKEKLKFVEDVREFAIQKLYLNPNAGYKYYVELDREELGWNVSASEELEFKPHTWWFPIAGRVPYKGFFDYNLAKEEEKSLKEKGLDTRIRITGGYSTLGWLSDPIYSTQLKWSRPKIAGLVIHEMAHATVYIKGESRFNESYASFVEEKGLEIFYSQFYPQDKDYIKEKLSKSNQKRVLEIIKDTAFRLDGVYKSKIEDHKKREMKKEIIQDFKKNIIKEKLVMRENQTKFLNKDWNNEDFIGIFLYNSGEEYFSQIFEESGRDFSEFHKRVIEFEKLTPEEKKKTGLSMD